MRYMCLFATGCLLSGLISVPVYAATLSVIENTEEETKADTPLTAEQKARLQIIVDSIKKRALENKAKESKSDRLSFSTGYSNARANSKKSEGQSVSMSMSRRLSKTDTVYGFVFGSLSDTDSSGNNFNGDGLGLGAGYAHVTREGFILNASLTLSRTKTDGLAAQGLSASRSNAARVSLGLSKPFVISTQDVVTPSLSFSQSVGSHTKPTFRLSPKVTYARQFSSKWRGSVFVGGAGSHKNITLSGRKAYVDFGLGANYLITDEVSAGVSYTRTESTGGHHGNNVQLSISTPF